MTTEELKKEAGKVRILIEDLDYADGFIGLTKEQMAENYIIDALKRAHDEGFNRGLQRAVGLSDQIEVGHDSTLEEWKAFKHFRNTLRDELKGMQP